MFQKAAELSFSRLQTNTLMRSGKKKKRNSETYIQRHNLKGCFSYSGAWCRSGTPLPFTKCAFKMKQSLSGNLVSDRPVEYFDVRFKGLSLNYCTVGLLCLWILFTQRGKNTPHHLQLFYVRE